MTTRKKSGGSKLNRSEILQARLNPKLRLAAEIISRHQRRTVSSLIEVLMEEAMVRHKVPVLSTPAAQVKANLIGKIKPQQLTVKEVIDCIWSAEEADRFARFALFIPELLSPEEDKVWEVITYLPYFWEHFEIRVEDKKGKLLGKEPWPVINHKGLIYEHLREHWPLIKSILEGKADVQKLKQLKLPPGKIVKKPHDYPYPVKKVAPSHD
jgi:hypothetical protein